VPQKTSRAGTGHGARLSRELVRERAETIATRPLKNTGVRTTPQPDEKSKRRPSARDLQRALVAGVGADVLKHGAEAAEAARKKDPLGYLKFANTLVHENKPTPKAASPLDHLSDEQLESKIAYYDREIAILTGQATAAEGTEDDGVGDAAPLPLPPVSETS